LFGLDESNQSVSVNRSNIRQLPTVGGRRLIQIYLPEVLQALPVLF
jgi:hypothetical protein